MTSDPTWEQVRPLVEALRDSAAEWNVTLPGSVLGRDVDALVALLPPVPQWSEAIEWEVQSGSRFKLKMRTYDNGEIQFDIKKPTSDDPKVGEFICCNLTADAARMLRDQLDGLLVDRTPARSPLPTDWEPSEQEVEDYCHARGWGTLSTFNRDYARVSLIASHRNGWDARPSRIGGTP